MTDVLSGSIGIEVEQQRVRRLRQRGRERVRERRSKPESATVTVGRTVSYEERLISRGRPLKLDSRRKSDDACSMRRPPGRALVRRGVQRPVARASRWPRSTVEIEAEWKAVRGRPWPCRLRISVYRRYSLCAFPHDFAASRYSRTVRGRGVNRCRFPGHVGVQHRTETECLLGAGSVQDPGLNGGQRVLC